MLEAAALLIVLSYQRSDISDVCFRLEAMEMQDQAIRFEQIDSQSNPSALPALIAEGQRIDREDTAAMKQIVAQYGWPTISKFGAKCANTAWLLVQHADLDHDFQEHCLALMKDLIPKHEVSAPNYAYLFDRVARARGRKQRYGTQLKIVGKSLILQPTEDVANLDRRRKSVGLTPEKPYIEMATEMYFPKKP